MLETLSGMWNNFLSIFDSIPEDNLAIAVYVFGTLIILWCWYGVVKRLPATLGAILWIIVFAIIATPTVSEGQNAELAPAFFGLLFGVLTKEMSLVWFNASLIVFVIGIGLVIGFCWSKYSATNKNTASKKTSPL